MKHKLKQLLFRKGRPNERVVRSPITQQLCAHGFGHDLTTAARQGGGRLHANGTTCVVLTDTALRRSKRARRQGVNRSKSP